MWTVENKWQNKKASKSWIKYIHFINLSALTNMLCLRASLFFIFFQFRVVVVVVVFAKSFSFASITCYFLAHSFEFRIKFTLIWFRWDVIVIKEKCQKGHSFDSSCRQFNFWNFPLWIGFNLRIKNADRQIFVFVSSFFFYDNSFGIIFRDAYKSFYSVFFH